MDTVRGSAVAIAFILCLAIFAYATRPRHAIYYVPVSIARAESLPWNVRAVHGSDDGSTLLLGRYTRGGDMIFARSDCGDAVWDALIIDAARRTMTVLLANGTRVLIA